MRSGGFGLLFPLLTLCLAGCVATSPQVSRESAYTASCRQLYRDLDTLTDRHGARDHGPVQVNGFPYLRSNRFLASFANHMNDSQFETWMRHLAALDTQARVFERTNLATAAPASLPDAQQVQRCGEQMLAADLVQPKLREPIKHAAQVPDDYLVTWRAAGMYPLTALFARRGIAGWHREARATFATSVAQLPVYGQLQRWSARDAGALTAAEVRRLVDVSRDALDIPQPQGASLQRLFANFAPNWEVDVVSDDDRIGAVRFADGAGVDVGTPVEYRLLSQTRHAGRVLLQLNYVVWFPARSGNDRYAGRLDGLTWRVTLGADGMPLLSDAIHNCGCYLEFFPSPRLQMRSDSMGAYRETPLLRQNAPAQPVVIRLSHATHYIERVYTDDAARAVTPMTVRDYDELRSLPDGNTHRSLFGAHGIVAGSERGERFLLWPMGIRSPGAMRQWGHHPVAFVGRRHFDDAGLIDEIFDTVDSHAQQ